MLKKQSQLIHCSVMSKDGLHSILITATYGLHSIEDRKPLWAELQQLDNATVPWLVMGDYNAVLNSGDRFNGSTVTDGEPRDFIHLLDSTDLLEIKSVGPYFSWSNKGSGTDRVMSRIYWALGNSCWMNSYPSVVTEYFNPGISDHSPLMITCHSSGQSGGRPFQFFNYIICAIIQTLKM